MSGDGLVGRVSNVYPDTAVVTLLSDTQFFVAALDLRTGVRGVVHIGPGGPLILDHVSKQLVVHPGDVIVTLGTRDPRDPLLSRPGSRSDASRTPLRPTRRRFLQVQLQPYANFGLLDSVAVLVASKKHK